MDNNGFGIAELTNGAAKATKKAIIPQIIKLNSSITILAKGSR